MTGRTSHHGIYAAVATPLGRDFLPDLPRFMDHCQWLLANGCDGLTPLGTTGEANSIGLEARLSFIERIGSSDLPKSRLIVGTGSTSIADTVRLSRAVIDAGIDSLLMLPPFFYKSPTEDGLFSHFAAVAEQLSDRQPRIFLYHFPQMSAVPITIPLIRRLREAFPGLFVGVKDSTGDFDSTSAFIREIPGFETFAGTEELAAPTLEAGGSGCISATVNVVAPLVARRVAETDDGRAAELDRAISGSRAAISALHNVSGTKAALSVFRNDPEWRRCAPPNVTLDEATAAALADQLDRLGGLRACFG